MLSLHFGQELPGALKILCLGAHSDDIEIGCGGTILRLMHSYKDCHVTWVVFSAKGQRRREALCSARRFLKDARKTIITKGFKESYFPYRGEDIKQFFEQLKKRIAPDLNTFRHHQILEYEIPKYDGDLGQPNFYVPLTQTLCKKKVQYLMEGFSTQRSRQWFTEDTFYSLLRLRGIESKAPDKYAEAFYARKLVLE
jgi:hypothetical protein